MISLSSLSALLRRQAAPPNLGDILAWLERSHVANDFYDLVRMVLPDMEPQFRMSLAGEVELVADFVRAFETRYFPIHEWDWEDVYEEGGSPIAMLVKGYFIEPFGIDPEEYESGAGEWRPAVVLLSSLCASTLAGEGARLSYIDAARGLVGDDLAGAIPDDPYTVAALEQRLTGTRFAPVITLARKLTCTCGNTWLDTTEEEMMENYTHINWDMPTVETLKEEFDAARLQEQALDELMAWMEEDLPTHFAQLLQQLHYEGDMALQGVLPLAVEGDFDE